MSSPGNWSPAQCLTGAAANATSLCLVTDCEGSDFGDGSCSYSLELCTAGSTYYTMYFGHEQVACQWSCHMECNSDCNPDYATVDDTTCALDALAGTIGVSGTTYSIYDAVNTLYLSYAVNDATYTELFVDMDDATTSSFIGYFLTAAQTAVPAATTTTPAYTPMTYTSSSPSLALPISTSGVLGASSTPVMTGGAAASSSTADAVAAASSTAALSSSAIASQASSTASAAGTSPSAASSAAAAASSAKSEGGGRKKTCKSSLTAGILIIVAVLLS